MYPFGPFRGQLEIFGQILSYWKLFGTIWSYLKLFRAIWSQLKPFGAIQITLALKDGLGLKGKPSSDNTSAGTKMHSVGEGQHPLSLSTASTSPVAHGTR